MTDTTSAPITIDALIKASKYLFKINIVFLSYVVFDALVLLFAPEGFALYSILPALAIVIYELVILFGLNRSIKEYNALGNNLPTFWSKEILWSPISTSAWGLGIAFGYFPITAPFEIIMFAIAATYDAWLMGTKLTAEKIAKES